jgi:hypothetical protein
MPPKAYQSQSMFRGAHHFNMRDLVNALDATQVNVVNEAGMQLGGKSMAWHSTVKHLHSDPSLTPIVLNPLIFPMHSYPNSSSWKMEVWMSSMKR